MIQFLYQMEMKILDDINKKQMIRKKIFDIYPSLVIHTKNILFLSLL